MALGFLGSASDSRTTNTSQNAGFSEVAGGVTSLNVTGGGKKSAQVINVTDAGAISGGLNLAERVASGAYGATSDALKQVELAGSRANSLASEALQAVAANSRTESENFGQNALKWGAYVAIALGLFWMLGRAKG